jgi:S1-C subfamily serine protease
MSVLEESMSGHRYKFAGRSLLMAVLLAVGLSPALQAQEEDHGYIGINFEDSACGEKENRQGEWVWVCTLPPLINKVWEVGPAYAAGMRVGDVIVGVNGFDILTEEGSHQFGSMRVGVPTSFWIRRDGEELALTVTPATKEEAFGEDAKWVELEEQASREDSLRVQMQEMYEGHVRLYYALQNAKVYLDRLELQLQEEPSEDRQRQVLRLRTQIDSINRRLLESEVRIRFHADSLAVHTLVLPSERVDLALPEIATAMPATEAQTITVYSDAVAGARFEELGAGSPWLSVLPGIEEGLLVVRVIEDTPAYVAGLREGDVVISVDRERVSTVSDLRARLLEARRGARDAEFVFVRQGKKLACKIPTR